MDQYLKVDQWQKKSEKESKKDENQKEDQKEHQDHTAFGIDIDQNLRFEKG